MYVNCGIQTELVSAIIIYKDIFSLETGLSYMDFLQYKWLCRNKEFPATYLNTKSWQLLESDSNRNLTPAFGLAP